jgi:3-hydroxyisobutyrate dehydrogenase
MNNDDYLAVIGLGAIGGAVAGNLLAAGFKVYGYDPDSEAMRRFVTAGGSRCTSAGEAIRDASVILTALPSAASLMSVLGEGATTRRIEGRVIAELGTFGLNDKLEAQTLASSFGATLLDCAVSGTGAQALKRDLLILASGEEQAIDRAQPAFAAISRKTFRLGTFGSATRFKLVTNLLVAIHSLAAAEALTLGAKVGLDRQSLYELLSDSAGASRMLQVRGPMMVSGDYSSPGGSIGLVTKDLALIDELARSVDCPTPLFSAALGFYRSANAQGLGKSEIASVCTVLERLAGIDRAAIQA